MTIQKSIIIRFSTATMTTRRMRHMARLYYFAFIILAKFQKQYFDL